MNTYAEQHFPFAKYRIRFSYETTCVLSSTLQKCNSLSNLRTRETHNLVHSHGDALQIVILLLMLYGIME